MEYTQFEPGATVVDRNGMVTGTLIAVESRDDGGVVLQVRMEGGREVEVLSDQVDAGSSTPDRVVVDLETETTHHATLPLAAEEPVVSSTEWVEKGRVRIHKRVETVPYEETIELAREGVEVEHVPIDSLLDELPQVRTEGETTVIPITEEVLVVQKRYRLVEEVRVTSTKTTELQTIREDLRREVLEFEETATDQDDDER